MKDEIPLSPPQHQLFLKFFSAERHRIFRFIFSLVPAVADAEDVYQQTSIVLWEKFADYDQTREFFPWACGVARYCVMSFRRKNKNRKVLFNDDLVNLLAIACGESSQQRHRQDLLEECMAMIKAEDRTLLCRVYVEGSSVGSVAKRQGRAVQTIYNRLNIIRKQLLECVERKNALS